VQEFDDAFSRDSVHVVLTPLGFARFFFFGGLIGSPSRDASSAIGMNQRLHQQPQADMSLNCLNSNSSEGTRFFP
jgi:hypothetical protein